MMLLKETMHAEFISSGMFEENVNEVRIHCQLNDMTVCCIKKDEEDRLLIGYTRSKNDKVIYDYMTYILSTDEMAKLHSHVFIGD
ncbi:MAG: hypothetical protein RSC92_00305 [Clostridia bacterium]